MVPATTARNAYEQSRRSHERSRAIRAGDRLPPQYRSNRQYVVNDWQQRHLRKPPRGYHWVRDDNNNYFLAAVTTGVILDLLLNGGR